MGESSIESKRRACRWLTAIAVLGLHGTLLLVYWWPESKELVGDEVLYL